MLSTMFNFSSNNDHVLINTDPNNADVAITFHALTFNNLSNQVKHFASQSAIFAPKSYVLTHLINTALTDVNHKYNILYNNCHGNIAFMVGACKNFNNLSYYRAKLNRFKAINLKQLKHAKRLNPDNINLVWFN